MHLSISKMAGLKMAWLPAAILALAAPAGAASYAFNSLNYPASYQGDTFGLGINDAGQVVGTALSPTGGPSTTPRYDLFVYDNGNYQSIYNRPAAGGFDSPGNVRQAVINNSGEVAFTTYDPSSLPGAHYGYFLYKDGAFTNLGQIGGNPTFTGINSAGTIVGSDQLHGFVYDKGTLTTINVPASLVNPGSIGTYVTEVTGINDDGTIVGNYFFPINGNDQGTWHAFVYRNGSFATISFPGSVPYITDEADPLHTGVFGINNEGTILANANGLGTQLLYANGTVDTISSDVYNVTGINDSGQIVGIAFVASPTPEPTSLLLLFTGLVGIGLACRCKYAARVR